MPPRTKSGCWTCRLRTKKKCDETQPSCKRCAQLRIHCFGYGERPTQDELGGDRRALISRVEGAAGKEDSNFRVWRLPSHKAPKKGFSSSKESSAERSPDLGDLTALDRVNSHVLDFLHPLLVKNYTDNVFWLDSRLYQSPGPYGGNSWLAGFLQRSTETHLAAALMGLTWRALQMDQTRIISIELTRPIMTLQGLVLKSVKDQINRSQTLISKNEMETLAANLSKSAAVLLIFEVWRTLVGDWIPHLRGMSDILRWTIRHVPDVLNEAAKMGVQGDPAMDYQSAPALAGGGPIPDRTLNCLALRWFLQSYLWNDISAAVWVGPNYTTSRCNGYYIPLLKKKYTQLEKFMGCRDLVLFLISQVSLLEEALLNPADDNTLEYLVSEAENLDKELNKTLQQIQREGSFGKERDAALISEMWTHSALVYLHAVVSGSWSSHPKLRGYVARGLAAYQSLPRRLDIHIALPFGVLASMADEKERPAFMSIAETSRVFEEINPGQQKTFLIVRECWRLRDQLSQLKQSSPAAGVNWRDGAKSLGLVILPV